MSSKVVAAFICIFLSVVTTIAQLIPYGTKNVFELENKVQITDVKNSRYSPGYTISGKLTVSSVWNSSDTQLLFFEFHPPKLSVKQSDNQKEQINTPESSLLDNIPKQSFCLVLQDGKATQFLIDHEKDVSLINLKKGIASLFQFKLSDVPQTEQDSSGQCSVIYQTESSTKYKKIKTDCSNWNLKVHKRGNGPLGVFVNSYQDIFYKLSEDGHLEQIVSTEKHSVFLEAKPDVGSNIESLFKLRHVASEDVEQFKQSDLLAAIDNIGGHKKIDLEADIDGSLRNDKGNLKKIIKSSQSEMADENIGTETAALHLIKLLPTVRATSTDVLLQILKAHSTKDIRKQLIDLFGAAQTEDAHSAITQAFPFGVDDNLEHLERYLQALAVGTRAKSEIIKYIKGELHEASKNEKLIDTTIQTLSALSGRLAQISSDRYDDKVVVDIQQFLLSELANCESPECKEVYIRGLQNLRDPKTIRILLKTVLEEGTIVSVAAMKALRSFSVKDFTKEDRKDLERIFYQIKKHFDSSARTIALDILLDLKPDRDQLRELLLYLTSNDKAFEVKTYLLQKVKMITGKCPRFSSLIRDILLHTPELNNYHVIAQKGLTTVLERTLSRSPSFNETLLSIQEIKDGILKRGEVNMILQANGKEDNVFKLGLYTKGLSSFVGNSDEVEEKAEGQDEDIPTAGMEISVQGVSFRPLVFFNGQSELMGHVWSGTASDPTPAYQATTLLHDHEEYIILQNGGTVYLNVLGAKSVDLNGQIQFSLWNRNAHTEISKNYGTAIQGSMLFGTSFITIENQFTTAGEPKINLIADIDFYSDIMLCIRLSRPESSLWYKTVKRLSLPGSNYSTQNSVNVTYKLPGSTLALNRKNNEMCNRIFA